MNVYISCSSTDLNKHLDDYEIIRETILNLGHDIPVDWLKRFVHQTNNDSDRSKLKPNIVNEGIGGVEESSFLIADVSIPSASVGYQIAFALSKKIPVLCLYSEYFGTKKAPQIIGASESSLLSVSSYNKKSLKRILKSFFKNFHSEKLIKFNFIITPEINNYIDWGAKKFNISKSEFLRRKVQNSLIKIDKDYQNS